MSTTGLFVERVYLLSEESTLLSLSMLKDNVKRKVGDLVMSNAGLPVIVHLTQPKILRDDDKGCEFIEMGITIALRDTMDADLRDVVYIQSKTDPALLINGRIYIREPQIGEGFYRRES